MIYQISAGQGPAECELGVAKLLTYLQSNFDVSVLDSSPGWHRGTYRSVRIYTEADLSDFIGSVRWTCRSPYINKVESGIRAIYLLTGQAVVCTEERSQHANKQRALARLRNLIEQANAEKKATEKNDNWRFHSQLERGNASYRFEGMSFSKA